MAVFVALLRAVNVGGTGKLAMSELRRICEEIGFESVATYIQSGNVVFRTKLAAARVKHELERALASHMKKPVGVLVRTPAEMAAVVRRNPFPSAPPNRVMVTFLSQPVPKKAFAGLEIVGREQVEPSSREIFVHYPDGMGRSKLKLPFAKEGTVRNMNTVAKLAAMARELASD